MEIDYQKKIVQWISTCGIKDQVYRDELVDHYCTLYETEIITTDKQELLNTIENAINNHYQINKKRVFMFNAMYLATAICLVLFILGKLGNDNNQDVTLEDNNNNTEHVYDPPYGYPIDVRKISATYGDKKHPITKALKFHKGIDFPATIGTKIFTVEKGQVIDTGYDNKLGNYIVIKHDEIYTTRYHHLKEILVSKGDKVQKNQTIGSVGSTGLSTGPHLHYEIIKNGKNVDPESFLIAVNYKKDIELMGSWSSVIHYLYDNC